MSFGGMVHLDTFDLLATMLISQTWFSSIGLSDHPLIIAWQSLHIPINVI